jgi:hypothetical protein
LEPEEEEDDDESDETNGNGLSLTNWNVVDGVLFDSGASTRTF